MPTDKTPQGADETLPLPVTSGDDVVEETTADETAVLAVDETLTLPVPGQTDEVAEDATPTEVADAAPSDETVAATEAVTEPAPPAYTSPIGALYAPTTPADGGYATVTEPVAPAPADEPVAPAPRRRLRVGTVVWGLIIAAIGVGLLAWAAGFAIDLQLAMIVLLAVAGTALLVGSIVSGARNARR